MGFCKFSVFLVFLILLQGGTPFASGVHQGGVAACKYCHVMHNGGPAGQGGGNRPLLLDGAISDLCLNCHATDFGSVMGVDPQNPPPERGPGNFVFLSEVNINDSPDGINNPISGHSGGHNINAPGHGISSDGTYSNSPGGSFPSAQLKCTSCHDPHGNDNYRFLRGPSQQQGSGGGIPFVFPAPDATGLDFVISGPESDINHIAYKSGMSLWCANCHRDYLSFDHQTGATTFEHPTDDTFDGNILIWYNNYNGTADPTGGDPSTSYLASVPFEDPGNTVAGTSGPTATSRIMCLTCHRAHASSAPHAGRWDFNVETLGQDGVVSGSYAIPNPYPDPNQQSLCYKCHETGSD